MSNITYDGQDLSSYLATSEVQGFHDSAGIVVSETYVPGYALPNESVMRDELVDLHIRCSVAGDDHAALVSKLHTIRTYVSPRLGWKYLSVVDISAKRTLARFDGFPVAIDVIPYYITSIEFTLSGRRAPWWEDATAQTDADVTNSEVIANSGDVECYPTWTLTSTDANATGVTLTCNGKTFTWEDAFPATDIIIIETELPTVTYEGTENYAGIADDCEFPTFAPGNNTVTFTGDMTVSASWRRRYE